MGSQGVERFGFALLFGTLWMGATASARTASDRPPNIVLFFCDDLGFADVACYGHPYAQTPAIDRLAREGTRFTQHYVTGVTCNPSRTGLMTGVHPARYPRYAADFGFGEHPTVTEWLKRRGYRTGHFGKWHMGPAGDAVDGTYGIDTVRVIGKSRAASAGRDDDLVTAAIDFMRDNADRPFYVNIWGHSTHFPVNTPAELAGVFSAVHVRREDFSDTMQHKFDACLEIGGHLDDAMRQYLGDVYSIDRNVDRVLDALDALGLRDETLVVFSSDHGPAPVVLGAQRTWREFSCNMLGYAGPFRGGKHEQYEGGTRVPFIIRWPGHVPAGRVDTESVTSFIDWLPTLCTIAGIDPHPDGLDGEDVSEAWFGRSRPRRRPLFWRVSATGAAPAMREGNWKLHLPRRKGQALELYDLVGDPSESHNVAAEHPQVVTALRTRLDAWVDGLPQTYEKKETRTPRRDRRRGPP